MKRNLSLVIFTLILGLVIPGNAFAADKEKKEKKQKKAWKWEMPSELTGDADFDNYLKTCDELNTKIVSYMDSVTFYTVKKINITQEDGTVVERRCVVDENGNIRGSSEALAQYIQMTNSGMGILNDMLNITNQTTAASAYITKNPLKVIKYGKYLKAGPKIVAEGGKTMKALLKRMTEQKKEIRQYKKDYSESGELKNPTTDAATIDANYSDNEPITKTSKDFDKELAAAMAKDKTIKIPDGDIDFEG